MKTTVFPLLLALMSMAANANTFPFAAVIDDADGPVDGLVSLELRLVDEGAVLWTETQPAVVVVDGVMAVDVGAATALPAEVPTQAALVMVVDGDELPALPLARLFQAQATIRAQRATTATRAGSLNGATPADVATRTAVGAAGGPPVAFTNITGVAAAIADGDQGTDVTSTSADFAISARTLSVATVNGSRLAAASVDGVRLASGSVTATQVADSAITAAKLANNAFTRTRLAVDITSTETKTVTVFQLPAGCGGDLSTQQTCRTPACGNANLGLRTSCDGLTCGLLPGSSCSGTAIGKVVVDQ
jgi:hypothetical protein